MPLWKVRKNAPRRRAIEQYKAISQRGTRFIQAESRQASVKNDLVWILPMSKRWGKAFSWMPNGKWNMITYDWIDCIPSLTLFFSSSLQTLFPSLTKAPHLKQCFSTSTPLRCEDFNSQEHWELKSTRPKGTGLLFRVGKLLTLIWSVLCCCFLRLLLFLLIYYSCELPGVMSHKLGSCSNLLSEQISKQTMAWPFPHTYKQPAATAFMIVSLLLFLVQR